MRQREDFRTNSDGVTSAGAGSATPLFDDQSTLRAAPVVPLEQVARRKPFARFAADDWRERMRSPQFRRSWPLVLLLAATLAAAVAAVSIYSHDDHDDARTAATATSSATNVPAAADAGKTIAPPARTEPESSRKARDARRGRENENVAAPGAVTLDNSEAFTASALGNFTGGVGDADDEQGDAAASGGDERRGERDRGKQNKRSKRRQGARRGGGGAVLFDVIR